MTAAATEPVLPFPLCTFPNVHKLLSPPEGPFDAAGPWKANYGIYTLAGRPGRLGSLSLRRHVGGQGRVAIDLQHRKRLTGGEAILTAKLQLATGNRLSTPVRWQFSRRVTAEQGLVPGTQLAKSAVFASGKIEIGDGRTTRRIAMPGAYTLNWALFDAVTRLPREQTEPIEFTLIDHFDQVKPNHRLSFRESVDVTFSGKPVTLHAYDHLGEGIVPWVYHVDDAGRLLVAVSGLEGYLWEG